MDLIFDKLRVFVWASENALRALFWTEIALCDSEVAIHFILV